MTPPTEHRNRQQYISCLLLMNCSAGRGSRQPGLWPTTGRSVRGPGDSRHPEMLEPNSVRADSSCRNGALAQNSGSGVNPRFRGLLCRGPSEACAPFVYANLRVLVDPATNLCLPIERRRQSPFRGAAVDRGRGLRADWHNESAAVRARRIGSARALNGSVGVRLGL